MTSQISPTPHRVKHRLAASILFAAVTVIVAAVGMCGVAAAVDPPPKVTYQLSGSAPVADLVTYQTDTGQAIQAHVPLPWQMQFTSFGPEVFLISAQSPGPVTCTILLNGEMVRQATANGAPARTVCAH